MRNDIIYDNKGKVTLGAGAKRKGPLRQLAGPCAHVQ